VNGLFANCAFLRINEKSTMLLDLEWKNPVANVLCGSLQMVPKADMYISLWAPSFLFPPPRFLRHSSGPI